MCLRGGFHADAGMRPLLVVEADERADALPCVLQALEAALAVDDLGLEDAVHTLGYGVVRGLVVLRHRDADAVPLQLVRIGITTVLYAPVGVVDEVPQLLGRCLRDGHSESLERVFRLQRLGEAPAHNLSRVGVRHEVQVAAALHEVYVRNVAHPELVGTCRHKAADEVPVLVVAVVRVRRVARLGAPLHQLEVAKKVQEGISPRHPVAKEHTLHHQPQLVVPDAGVHLAYLPDGIHDAHHTGKVLTVALLLLVIGLLASVKQFTAINYRIARIAVQALYCLTPDFFRIFRPCSSATSMSVLSARFLS